MVKGINIEEIYYGKEYQVASKIPTERFNKICDALSDDECIYIVYRRDSASHPFQNGYDIFDTFGEKIKKERVLSFKEKSISLGREDIDRAIDKVLETRGNIDKNCDLEIVKKLSPSILELKEGLYENYMNSITFFE